ncbi:MAG: hypothetical protein ACRETX_16650, partial [Steroidobacteraceae bacterium]
TTATLYARMTMAARQSMSRRRRARNRRARPTSSAPAKSASAARQTKEDSVKPADGTEPLREYLRDLARNLHRIMSVVIVAVEALEGQNCDCDAHVAQILRSYAGNKLDIEIEASQKLLANLERGSRAAAK